MSTRSRSTGPVSAVRSDWPVAPDFHPEFGFLCPSPSRLRRLRVAMTLTLAGIGIGATIELAVAHWGDSGAAAQTLIAGPIEEEPLGKAAAVPRPSGIRIASMQPSESAALTETWPLPQHGSCKDAVSRDPAASFLNPDCWSGKVHARHAGRTAYRVATFIVGRTDLPPAPTAFEAMPYSATGREKR